ncbi:hypothetical protein ACIQZD_10235 [Peribacillus sp. NPDC096447]|uniref:hypothetical protein n=1 Tax=Peribacillus sp. NPDC096447 TaxID=3364394 RepID=UPI00381087D5
MKYNGIKREIICNDRKCNPVPAYPFYASACRIHYIIVFFLSGHFNRSKRIEEKLDKALKEIAKKKKNKKTPKSESFFYMRSIIFER